MLSPVHIQISFACNHRLIEPWFTNGSVIRKKYRLFAEYAANTRLQAMHSYPQAGDSEKDYSLYLALASILKMTINWQATIYIKLHGPLQMTLQV